MAKPTTTVRHDSGFQKLVANALNHRILSRDEERGLILRAQSGDAAAMRQLGELNLKLILFFANRLGALGAVMGFTQSDLFNEAYEGFHKAVYRFKTSKKVRLSTYAQWWMLHAVQRAVENKGRTIRVPAHMQGAMRRIDRAARRFLAEFGRAPTRAELCKAARVSPEEVALAESVPTEPLSYDAHVQVRDGETTHLLDAHPDPHAEKRTPFDEAEANQGVGRVKDARKRLSTLENAILDCRYKRELTLTETATAVAKHSGGVLSRERIRQIQQEAEDKLRMMLQPVEAA